MIQLNSTQDGILNSKAIFLGGLFIFATILGIPVWKEYLHGDFLFYVTILLAPYILYVQQTTVSSSRYAWASIIAAIGHLLLGMNILFLAAYLFFILFLVEWKWGKLNALSMYWMFMLSPLTIFLFGVFSFPIRLELSTLASWIIQFIQPNLNCQGNIIVVNGSEFSVDEACMGLKMVRYSYLAFLVLIAHFEKATNTYLSKPLVVLMLSLGTLFILFANLIRIITVILAKAMPETVAHEAIGIFSWVVYVIFPSFLLIKIMVQKWGKIHPVATPYKLPLNLVLGLILSCLTLLAIGGYQTLIDDRLPPKANLPIQLKGFSQRTTKDGVVQLKNNEALIYIKPSCPPYRADHSPNICWKGSGYSFSKEQLTTIRTIPVITAQLKKGDDVLHTAWWYDNGKHKTASQIVWRWNALKGIGNYQLINVTVEDPSLLDKYINLLLSQN